MKQVVIADDLPKASPRGYVEFRSDRMSGELATRIPIKVTTIDPGELSHWYAPYGSYLLLPFRLACPPGERSFEVGFRDVSDYAGPFTKITVPVQEGQISVVGLRQQGGVLTGRLIGYYYIDPNDIAYIEAETRTDIVATVGTHALPVEQGAEKIAACEAALDDRDWATRLVALEGLGAVSPDATLVARVSLLAREDRNDVVRAAAKGFLGSRKLPLPPKPFYLDTFAQNTDHDWWRTRDKDADMDFSQNGFVMTILSDTARWSLGRGVDTFGSENLDIELDCACLSGSSSACYGLAVCQSDHDFIVFCVTPAGSISASIWSDDKRVGDLIPLGSIGARGMAARNPTRIAVSKRGFDYSVSINGSIFGSYVDDRRLDISNFGPIVMGISQVEFDRLALYQPGDEQAARPRKTGRPQGFLLFTIAWDSLQFSLHSKPVWRGSQGISRFHFSPIS